jgi:uncharacterized protein (DUF4415 family)
MESRKPGPPPPDFDDDAPVLTEEEIRQLRPASEWFAEAGIPMPVPRGRPRAEQPKRSVTMRLDAGVVDYFKSTGPGWQTRINDLLVREVHKKRSAA